MKLFTDQNLNRSTSASRLSDLISFVSSSIKENDDLSSSVSRLLLTTTAIISCDDYWNVIGDRSNVFVKNQKVSILVS
jgi:hypothetical protein